MESLQDLIDLFPIRSIHRLREHGDLPQTLSIEMLALRHPADDAGKLLEIDLLLGLQRVALKEFHHLEKAGQLSDSQLIAISTVAANHTAAEEPLERIEDLQVARVLDDAKLRQDLVTQAHLGMWRDADVEATLSIDKPHNPVWRQLHVPSGCPA